MGVTLSSKLHSSDEKYTMYKLFYVYLWAIILLYQPKDTKPWCTSEVMILILYKIIYSKFI
jgi:hypothetical protein